MNIPKTLSQELNINLKQVEAAIQLLEEGATVPFIARYRKEATGGLSDTQLRELVERLTYLTELEDRRQTILKSIQDQGLLTSELENLIQLADNKTRLEDLYLPFKPKRRTKAQIAKEAGLLPLVLELLKNQDLNPLKEAQKYINEEKEILDAKSVLDHAQYILMEMFAEDADLLEQLRQQFWSHALIVSKVIKNKEQEGIKFKDYYDFSEKIKSIPSHRVLALFRGRESDILHINIEFIDPQQDINCQNMIAEKFSINLKNQDHWLYHIVKLAWKAKIHTKLEVELMTALKERADTEAIAVFRDNLKNVLMMAPAGNRVVMGLDPGYRTGVKLVVIDGTGKLLEYVTIFPHAPQNEWQKSLAILAHLCKKLRVELISIGNGTASRETDSLVADLIKQHKELNLIKIVVSEAGASVYSASELAAKEFPDLDVTYRGAVSIARRLQDPLAELVKIDPKAIGVGQYQHDVNQIKLGNTLSAVVEDCVNTVGADINTASIPLLKSISGLNETIAKNIISYREQHGRFNNRKEILNVTRLGAKAYEQAVGFLRIIGGDNPLDASSVHPESYPLVDQILNDLKLPLSTVMGNSKLLNQLNPQKYISDSVGLPTIKDIIHELNKPGRDPRPEFRAAKFEDKIQEIKDLKPGMILEGVITNVANFGAFVDIGVHQDGLVHISELSYEYVHDIQKSVKTGDIVQVKVLQVDKERNRIQLSMKIEKSKMDKENKKVEKKLKETSKQSSLLAEKLKNALKK